MIENANFFEMGLDIIPDIVNGDVNSDLTGDWISMAKHDRAYLLLMKPAGTAGDDISIRLQQATSAAGAGAKALTFTRLWHKIASTSDFTGVTVWTPITLTTASSDLELDVVNSADLLTDINAAFVLVEVMASSLDVGNGFKFINVLYEGDDVGNACVINSLWLMAGARWPQAIPLSVLS